MFPAIGESPTMLSKGGNQDNDFYQGGNSAQLSLPARAQQIPMRIGKVGLDDRLRGSLALHTSIYISFSRFGRTKTLLAYKGRGKMFRGMRSPRYKMTASTYGECGNAWYYSFASEEIWRTGSTPVFRDIKAALKDRIKDRN